MPSYKKLLFEEYKKNELLCDYGIILCKIIDDDKSNFDEETRTRLYLIARELIIRKKEFID